MNNFDTDRIDQYLRQELPPEEVIVFEAAMQSDKDLADEVELRRILIAGIHHHHRGKLRSIFEEEEANFSKEQADNQAESKVKNLRPLSFLMAAAAIIVILILLRPILLPPQASSEEIFDQFAMHYAGGDLIKRDVDTCLAISDAVTIYDQQNYADAIPKFQAILVDSSSAQACNLNPKELQLLLGISYVFEGRMASGRPLLEGLSNEMETARWYLILSYVKEGIWEEVKGRLNKWNNPSNFYKKQIEMLKLNIPTSN